MVLTLTRNSTLFSNVAQDAQSAGRGRRAGSIPHDHPLFLDSLNQTADGRAASLRCAVGRDPCDALPGMLADDSRYVREAVLGRLMQANYTMRATRRWHRSPPRVRKSPRWIHKRWLLAIDDKSLGRRHRVQPLAFWTRAYGAWADFNGDGNAATADRNLGGFVSGMDAQLLAVAGASASPQAPLSPMSMWMRATVRRRSKSYHLGGYLGGMAGIFALRGGGMWAWSDIDTSRAVVFPGFFERQKASYNADTGQLFGEAAYPMRCGAWALEPFAGLAYVSVDGDNFHERGGALASLSGRQHGRERRLHDRRPARRADDALGSMLVTPHVSAAWQHAFDDVTPGAGTRFRHHRHRLRHLRRAAAEDSRSSTPASTSRSGRAPPRASPIQARFGDDVTTTPSKAASPGCSDSRAMSALGH